MAIKGVVAYDGKPIYTMVIIIATDAADLETGR